MRGFGGFQTYYYLQTLLTGDRETGRQTRTKFNSGPLPKNAALFKNTPN